MSAARRGFTLLEVALAAVLGSMVVLVAVSVFASLETADKLGQEAFDDSLSEALTHEAITKALNGLTMSNTIPAPRNAEGNRVRPGREYDPPEPPPDDRDIERPRLVLEFDQSLPPLMPDSESRSGDLVHPQRLEVALRARPLFVFGVERNVSIEELTALGDALDRDRDEAALGAGDGADAANAGSTAEGALGETGSRGDARASRRDRARGASRSDRLTDSPEAADGSRGRADEGVGASRLSDREARAAGVTTELVQGVRGAFEFEFDPGVEAGGFETQPGWVLWWRQIYPVVEDPFDAEPGPGQRTGRARLMGNIASATWHALYTRKSGASQGAEAERLLEHVAVWSDDLPGYIELDIQTNSGARHQWTFEIGWGVSGEPGSVASVTAPPTQPGAAAGLGPAGSVGDRARTPTGEGGRGSTLDRPRRSGSDRSGGSSSTPSSGGSRNDPEHRR